VRRLLQESLRARVLLASLTLSTGIIVGLTTLFLVGYSRDFSRQLFEQADSTAAFLANQCQFAMLVGDRGEMERLARTAVASDPVLFVEMSDDLGNQPVLLTRSGFPASAVPQEPRGGRRSAGGHPYIEIIRHVTPVTGGALSWQDGNAPRHLGILRVGYSTQKQSTARLRIVWATGAMALAGLLLTAGVHALQLRTLLGPLKSLTDFTREIAAGNLASRAPVLRPDEVGRLTEAFNRMVEQLGATTVSRDYVDAIIESMAESVIVIDSEGLVRTVNQATLQLLGYSADTLLHRPVHQICAAAAHLSGVGLEVNYVAASGKLLPVLVSAAPMRTRGSSFEGAVWVAQDVTARKQLEENLRHAKEAAEAAHAAKSAFLANMTHELRTPLNAVLGYSQLLQETCQERGLADIQADLANIERAGSILLHLVNQVLDFSKVEAGKMELHPETFDTRAVIQDVVTSVQPLATRNGNRLAVHGLPGASQIHTDLMCFRQSLMNLVANACKFTQNGQVEVHVGREGSQPDEWVVVSVRDTGIGISPDQQERLFQAFTQADASTTRRFGGTGLGLAISRKMCQLMGGDISVVSELGKGSTFAMRIPVQLDAPDGNRAW